MIRITAKQDGFRRCGVAHPATATDHPDSAFTGKELAILQAEPMLLVEVIAEAPSKPARPNVGDTVALVQAAATLEALEELVAGDDRKGVIDAAAKRRLELTPASEAPAE